MSEEIKEQDRKYPLPVVKKNGVGRSEDEHSRVKWMYNEE